MDENENWCTGEKIICESLSHFLVTFVLQEITLGSRLYLCDKNLDALYRAERHSAITLWADGPYVHGSRHNYFLWKDVLVANLWDSFFFAANRQEGIEFLLENQGPVNLVYLSVDQTVHQSWHLDLRADGSAHIRYVRGQKRDQTEQSS